MGALVPCGYNKANHKMHWATWKLETAIAQRREEISITDSECSRLSGAGDEPERYVGVDAVVLVPAGLGSVVALEDDSEQSGDPAQPAADVDVAVADVAVADVKGVRE